MFELFRFLFRVAISLLQYTAAAAWCFFFGTFFAVAILVIGFFIGVGGGGWADFHIGGAWILCHFAWFPLCVVYRVIYGEDEWYETETFFGY